MQTAQVYTANDGQSVYIIEYSNAQRTFRLTHHFSQGPHVSFHEQITEAIARIPKEHTLVYFRNSIND